MKISAMESYFQAGPALDIQGQWERNPTPQGPKAWYCSPAGALQHLPMTPNTLHYLQMMVAVKHIKLCPLVSDAA